MKRRTTIIVSSAIAAAAIAGATGFSALGDDNERPITGDELERASAAALAHTGGGHVSDTEVGDEDSWYEVEVTLPDGSQTDVQLDAEFNVVSSEADVEEPGDSD
jgi:hypothetical protein